MHFSSSPEFGPEASANTFLGYHLLKHTVIYPRNRQLFNAQTSSRCFTKTVDRTKLSCALNSIIEPKRSRSISIGIA